MVSDEDLPALFKSADRFSADGRSRRRIFFLGFLFCDLAAALVTATDVRSVVSSVASLMFVVLGLLGSILLLQETPEADWYGGRALAESIKTLAWRYMMCAEPYSYGLPSGEADRKLIQEMRELLIVERSLMRGLNMRNANDVQISPKMKEIRSMDVLNRKSIYLESRLRNQKAWYAGKARWAHCWLKYCSRFLVVVQLALVIQGISLVVYPVQHFSLIGFFSTVAASIVAWQQLNQFGGLAVAYNLTSHELAGIQSVVERAETERELEEFVLNAERAISREHTLWRARRTE